MTRLTEKRRKRKNPETLASQEQIKSFTPIAGFSSSKSAVTCTDILQASVSGENKTLILSGNKKGTYFFFSFLNFFQVMSVSTTMKTEDQSYSIKTDTRELSSLSFGFHLQQALQVPEKTVTSKFGNVMQMQALSLGPKKHRLNRLLVHLSPCVSIQLRNFWFACQIKDRGHWSILVHTLHL